MGLVTNFWPFSTPLDSAAEKECMFLSLANDKLCFMVEERIGRVGLGGYFEKASY